MQFHRGRGKQRMEKIGIMGGTFNPIHLAHLILAESAREQVGLSHVIFLPSKRTLEKADSYILSDEARCKLIELAIRDNPHFSLSKMEIVRGGTTYTADTVSELKRKNPDREYYFIIGGDSLLNFAYWNRPEVILKNARLLATSRGTIPKEKILAAAEYLEKCFDTEIVLFDTPKMEISSTDLRARCASGRSLRYLVPEAVEKFLRERGCYRNKSAFSCSAEMECEYEQQN